MGWWAIIDSCALLQCKMTVLILQIWTIFTLGRSCDTLSVTYCVVMYDMVCRCLVGGGIANAWQLLHCHEEGDSRNISCLNTLNLEDVFSTYLRHKRNATCSKAEAKCLKKLRSFAVCLMKRVMIPDDWSWIKGVHCGTMFQNIL